MKVIEIKKSYRNGVISHFLVFENDTDEYLIRDAVEDWAESDPNGSNYGYSIVYGEVTDITVKKTVLSEKLENMKQSLKRFTESMNRKIELTEKYLNNENC